MTEKFIFESHAIREVIETALKFAKANASLLIWGETGTGKEVFAKMIHNNSYRFEGPLISINCANIPKELFESELFGAERGAYTGCNQARMGLVEKAAEGTLFLDELSEMPIEVQAKLLRLLQDGDYRRVGSTEVRQTNVRIIASTNISPEECVTTGKLRRDLYYRVSTIMLPIPPLRDRLADIRPLALHFIRIISEAEKKQPAELGDTALRALENYAWPGNVRQLYGEIYRCVLLAGDRITNEHLSPHIRRPEIRAVDPSSKLTFMEQEEKLLILSMLRLTDWNKFKAAKRLGLGRQTLYNKIKLYGLEENKKAGDDSRFEEPDPIEVNR